MAAKIGHNTIHVPEICEMSGICMGRRPMYRSLNEMHCDGSNCSSGFWHLRLRQRSIRLRLVWSLLAAIFPHLTVFLPAGVRMHFYNVSIMSGGFRRFHYSNWCNVSGGRIRRTDEPMSQILCTLI